ncbi:MAG: hypothetical protein WCW31_05840 [Patescibacteria group bacterium]|jgi:hypothetical protein
MYENIGNDATREVKKTHEGKKMVEHAKDQRAEDKEGIQEFFRTNDKRLMTADLLKAGMTAENFVLAKEVYAEMAREAVGESDKKAVEILEDHLERIVKNEDIGSAWNAMTTQSPAKLANFVLETSAAIREAQEKQEKKEKTIALQRARAQLNKRSSITAEQAEEFQKLNKQWQESGTPEEQAREFEETRKEWEGVRQASVEGGGFAGAAEGHAPKEVKTEIGQAESRERHGKGFETARGEFELKAENFAIGLSVEKLKAVEDVKGIATGLTKIELAKFWPHAERYVANIDARKKEWTKAIDQAKKSGDKEKANKLQASSEKEAELNRTLLEELAKAIKNNPRILEQ